MFWRELRSWGYLKSLYKRELRSYLQVSNHILEKIRQKNLCSLLLLRLFCVMIFFCYCLFWGLPNLRFGSPAFLLGSFPPGLCGGSTTANSYSKSRSEPQNPDKSEGAMFFLRDVPMISTQTWCRISSQRKPIHFSNMLSTPESLGVWFLLTRRWKSIGKLQRPQEFPESEVTDLVTPPKCPQVDNSSFRKVICLQSSDFESEVQRASSCWRLLLGLCQVAPPIFWRDQKRQDLFMENSKHESRCTLPKTNMTTWMKMHVSELRGCISS